MPAVGQQIQHYKILSEIGKGGMGEVYLAEDIRLERHVALKFLRQEISQRSDRIARFIQEAKAASALNHPNIVTIYEIGEVDDLRFIASEFIEGVTLHELARKNRPSVRETIEIAIQIASALNAAHKVGVVHRDIKPENIMIREDGLVKVLDFGLAKLIEDSSKPRPIDSEANTKAQVDSRAGLVMGTMPYMSPEQARGQDVDSRSDIWSFGVVLYEMLTGKRPFDGETSSDTIAAILKTEPSPVTYLGIDVPKSLDHIIQKTLRKAKTERFQHIGDLQIDLKDVLEEIQLEHRSEQPTQRYTISDHGAAHSEESAYKQITTADQLSAAPSTVGDIEEKSAQSSSAKSIVLGAAVALTLLLVGTGLLWTYFSGPRLDSFQKMRFSSLTSKGNTLDKLVSISPDGRYVVYIAEEKGVQSLRLKQIATDSDVEIVTPKNRDFRGLSFSPDGNYIYYVTGEKEKPGDLFKVPVLGGTAFKIMEELDGAITVSPDGKQIAFVRNGRSLLVSNADGENLTTIINSSDGSNWTTLAWNPNGKSVSASTFNNSSKSMYLSEISLADGTASRMPGPEWLRISGLVWMPDGSGLVITGRDLETTISQVWFLSYPDGDVRRITNDLSNYIGLSLAKDASTIVSIQLERLANIWTVPASGGSTALKLTSEQGKDEGLSGVAWTPDGSIVYTVRETGKQDLWLVNVDGTEPIQLTKDAGSNFYPAASPDGKYLVFVSTRSGDINLWRTDTSGRSPHQLTDDPGIEGAPSFSPDGKTVVYQITDKNNKTTVWKIDIKGGRPRRLTLGESRFPAVSPDGKWIACEFGELNSKEPPRIALLPFGGGPPERLLEFPEVIASREIRWSPDSRGLMFIKTVDGIGNIFMKPIDNGSSVAITNFSSEKIYRFDVSPKGDGYVVARGTEGSNVVMIKDFR